jgi:hypothetical protein
MDYRSISGERNLNNMAIDTVTYKPILVMIRPWKYYFSPCIITLIICVILIIAGFVGFADTRYWFYFAFFVFGPALIILPIADFLVKALTHGNVRKTWNIEIVIVAIMFICYVYTLHS